MSEFFGLPFLARVFLGLVRCLSESLEVSSSTIAVSAILLGGEGMEESGGRGMSPRGRGMSLGDRWLPSKSGGTGKSGGKGLLSIEQGVLGRGMLSTPGESIWCE